ncbi:hypothetical protein [Salinimicrobium sediminilitoris]|uniref:hypothetical protein n=1 Tax=Salinimicrobium sediminilitoris TaxID=2876715 RepID=UPI001E4ABD5F|nr:hypothetical protein [Salinimicrobium sediminilitoris]MCC8359326.1 hypothetical protein [Salinimicrobium sediminilitoris]
MKYFIRTLFLTVLFTICFSKPVFSQANDVEAGLFNIGIGSVLGGVGAVINKKPGERTGKVLLKGLWQGAIGGYVVFESKRLVREFAETGDFGYVWPVKIVNSAGTSIIENAAANRNLWERWHLNIGFNRFEINTEENFRLSYRIMPAALVASFYPISEGKFHLKHSLKMGTLVFTTPKIEQDGYSFSGQSITNMILIREDQRGKLALPHELIHNFQYERVSGFNSFFIKPEKAIAKELGLTNLLKTYNKIFYNDYNAFLQAGLYWLANPGQEEYWKNNFFENEVEYYTNTLPKNNFFN